VGRGRTLLSIGVVIVLVAVVWIAVAHDDGRGEQPAGPPGPVALSGPWVLRSDHGNSGVARGWPRGGFAGSTVRVPFSPNANPQRLEGSGLATAFAGTIAWYRTRFSVPRAGDYALDFESVNHRAQVWVDGRLRSTHVGGYQPFEVTFPARAGRHVLVVRADYRDPARMKAEGWHRTWFNYGGIDRPVTLRPLGAADLATPAVTTTLRAGPDGRRAAVRLAVRVHNRGPARSIAVRGSLTSHGTRTPVSFAPVRLAHGAWGWARARVLLARPALWSPGDPQLYRLSLDVPGEAHWTGQTGLRQLTWSGRRLFVNGRRVTLRGASLAEDAYGHGDALSSADMDRLVAELRAIGANATRSQHPLAPALLDRLDAAGIMVWQGVGPVDSPGAFREGTPARLRESRARTRTSVRQLQLHPSIMAWSLANEVAGGGHRGGQAQFIDAEARELHRTDPGRLVGVDVWGSHPPRSDHGLLLYRDVDVVGLTNYAGWYSDTGATGAVLSAAVRDAVARFERAFPDKLVMVTEFGAEADPRVGGSAPGGYTYQSALLVAHIAAYESDPQLAGMLLWTLRDFEVTPSFRGGSIHRLLPGLVLPPGLNEKGLFTYRGAAKPAVGVVRDLYGRP
jgi:beta-galactosidase/beta-glucuronidase